MAANRPAVASPKAGGKSSPAVTTRASASGGSPAGRRRATPPTGAKRPEVKLSAKKGLVRSDSMKKIATKKVKTSPASVKSPVKKTATRDAARKPKSPAAKKGQAGKVDAKASHAAARRKVIAAAARTSHGRAVSATTEHDVAALESISVIRHAAAGDHGSRGAGAIRKRQYTRRELDKFRDMLLRVREELDRQMTSLRNSSLKREDAVNSEEDGTDAFERQLALNLASTEGDSIFAIDQALQRIDGGAYGVCETCGCLIGEDRLKALPFVQLCIECKSADEKRTSTTGRAARRP